MKIISHFWQSPTFDQIVERKAQTTLAELSRKSLAEAKIAHTCKASRTGQYGSGSSVGIEYMSFFFWANLKLFRSILSDEQVFPNKCFPQTKRHVTVLRMISFKKQNKYRFSEYDIKKSATCWPWYQIGTSDQQDPDLCQTINSVKQIT